MVTPPTLHHTGTTGPSLISVNMSFPRFAAAFAAVVFSLSVAFGQAFNPSDYGHVTLHLKADSLSLANNAAVTTWGPMAGAGATAPLFVASDPRFNGKPAVRFDGADDFMTWASANLNAQTIFAVVTLESTASSLAGLISNSGDRLNIRRHDTTTFYRSTTHGVDANDFTGNAPPGNLYVNNALSGGFTLGAVHLVTAVAGGQKNYSTFWIGSPTTSFARYWNGSVAEILVYDGPLTQQSINRVGYYLQTKYNLPTNFPQPTPTVRKFTATVPGPITSGTGVLSNSGADVTLSWEVENAASVSIDQGALTNSTDAVGSVIVNPTVTTTYTITAMNTAGPTTDTVTVYVGATVQPPRLNEFLAENEDSLTDEDGDSSDWIEIYNPNPFAIDLFGYRLKDSIDQWDFLAGSGVDAGGYRIVFASSKDRKNPASNLHTNFSLSNAGEYLALVSAADNSPVTEFPNYPPQKADRSYGYYGNPLKIGYFGQPYGAPTPGAANSATGVIGFLQDTDDSSFAIGRGFYTSAVTEVISGVTPGARIIYTTNGSEPTTTNGTIVNAPNANTPPSVTITIHPGTVPAGSPGVNIASIGGVTTLRAAIFKDGYAPTNVDTQTYLFTTQVLGQTVANATQKGWPATSVNGQIFNYGMDPNVTSSFTQAEMIQSLESLPTLSIVTNIANLVDSVTGIYVNADQHGVTWERPVSAELIFPPGYVDPDGNPNGFHLNAGLRIRGGFSRNDQFYKHGLRLSFSGKYSGSLKYRLFGGEGVNEFDKVDLATSSNYAWYRESDYGQGKFNTMCRDMFCRDSQGALGQPYTKSRFFHLYLNGHYWGVYYTEERADADFGASYLGGNPSEYDAVKCGNHVGGFQTEATDGDLTAWQTLWTKVRAIGTGSPTNANYFEILGRNPDGTRNPALPVLLDVDNLIDEMLIIFFAGDGDAVLSNFLSHNQPNNWFSVYHRTGDQGFRFMVHDAEHTLGTPSSLTDQTGPWGGSNISNFAFSNPQWMHEDLRSSAEYRLRFADRVRKHFFDGGALTPAQCIARFQKRANQVEKAMKAESARWGDAQSISNLPGGHVPRYVLADWQSAVSTVTASILPTRTQIVLNQLIADSLYPTVAAPAFTNSTGTPTYGGAVNTGFELRISASSGTIYYTLDGSDPRVPGGAIAPTALTAASPISVILNSTATIRARTKIGSVWSAMTEGQFLVGTLASADNLVISKIHYHPATANGLEEFIEFMNIGATSIDFTNCRFGAGIDFKFPPGFLLGAGARCLVVRDLAAFQAAYPEVAPASIVGAFANDTALNNGGEHLQLLAANGATIKDFNYDNEVPWPTPADGEGPCLVLINPAANPDPSGPTHWRSSALSGGTPGSSDSLGYNAWALANGVTDTVGTGDEDNDGLKTLTEYELGTNATARTAQPFTTAVQTFTVGGVANPYLTLTFTHSLGRDDAILAVEASSDLNQAWVPAVQASPAINHGNGTETVTYRHPDPKPTQSRQFLRINSIRVP